VSRRLAVIPIVHSEADLGKLAARVRESFGASVWRRRQRAVAELWRHVRDWASQLDPGSERIILYQDGLPDAKEAEAIVRELSACGSVNHQVLLDLMRRGATLVGSEDPKLLLREYELASRAASAAGNGRPGEGGDRELATILEQRDEYIANRIDQTLPPGGLGVLFIGALHRVESKLPEEIELTYPLGRPDVRGETRKEHRNAS
jgi:hypothetical protein